MDQMFGGFGEQLQNEVDIIDARVYEVIENIDKSHDEDGSNELCEEESQQAVLTGTVPISIADAKASANCGKPSTSNCGKYELDTDPFIPTGERSNKVFSMALGNIAPAEDIKRLSFDVCHPASKVHMVTGIKYNLLSMNQFAEAKYITIFDDDQVNIYDETSTKVTVS